MEKERKGRWRSAWRRVREESEAEEEKEDEELERRMRRIKGRGVKGG